MKYPYRKKTFLSSLRGTACSELAIFGGITLAAIGFMMRLGLQMNHQQETRMAAMRRCLKAARQDDSTLDDAVTTSVLVHMTRMGANPSGGGSTPRSDYMASASCLSGDMLTMAFEAQPDGSGPGQQRMVIFSNDTQLSKRQSNYPRGPFATAGFIGGFGSNAGETVTRNQSQETTLQQKEGDMQKVYAEISGNTFTTAEIPLIDDGGGATSISSTLSSGYSIDNGSGWQWTPTDWE